ncbi:inner membrane protein [Treponema primitia ZAS-2]|uniref:Inner membrane protein n=1 Tax=Treponema primitia (strain ATCC BAA-887 / DSM 12427 / ZAS-2) TaxID=545694 RepID=F5YHH6_TREPZ|nr:membrane protein insertase YidC [Treponema primitia]AEF85878.1 inner membrane protein [Treponema primitia ZAS-2]
MLTILYTLIIYPLIQIIELVYLFAYRVFDNHVTAILGVSLAVSICTLPLYFIAEKHQQAERTIQKQLKPKIDRIKAVYKGDEQYLILSTYYRQNNYHPVFALRTTFSLLIQIPFFIAAYSYLSNLSAIQGISFLLIKDLGKPDRLLQFMVNSTFIYINVLPIIMTLINCIAGAIYTKGFSNNEKIQLYVMALIFLVLLYNSPSALVLYWTLNNIFSLIKNIFQKLKNKRKIIYAILIIFTIFIDIYIIFIKVSSNILKKGLACIALSFILFLPLFDKYILKIRHKEKYVNDYPIVYILMPLIILFFLTGIIIPGMLIASSVQDFSFIENYTTPFPFILQTTIQAAGLFLLWPLILYFFFGKKSNAPFIIIFTCLSFCSLINAFLIQENFGFITVSMLFSDPKPFYSDYKLSIINGLLLIAVPIIVIYLFKSKKKFILLSAQIVVLMALFGLSLFSFIRINNDFSSILKERDFADNDSNMIQPLFSLSRNSNNVLLIMLDKAVSGYIPYILDEKPELYQFLKDFTWYPNCVSYADHTMVGAPPLYGGYEYTPIEINNKDSITLVEKQKEAYLLLPRVFSESGYQVSLNDPPFDNYLQSNLSVFANYPKINAENIISKYTNQWLQKHPKVTILSFTKLLNNNLIRFSFFKESPLFFRLFIYDDGEWLTTNQFDGTSKVRGALNIDTINNYAFLDYLSYLTNINDNDTPTLNEILCQLPHDPAFLQPPEYIPANNVINRGSGPFAEDEKYHANIASFILLDKWFKYLKDNDVYDNTRIIIVSDHGSNLAVNLPGSFILPDGRNIESYNALLLYKDFHQNSEEQELTIDNTFMTNADVPLLLMNNLFDNPVNIYTGLPLKSNKEDGVVITTIPALSSRNHYKNKLKIANNQWMHIKDNIFVPENWEALTLP